MRCLNLRYFFVLFTVLRMNNSSLDFPTKIPWNVTFTLSELVLWILTCSVVAIIAIAGNLLVIAAFVRAINLNSRVNYFVVGLATADILVGSISIPLWNYILYLTWKGAGISLLVTRVYEAFDVFAGVNSILHLMAVSTERLYATLKPYSWNNRSHSKKVYQCALVLIWTISSILASLFAIPMNKVVHTTRFHLMNIFFFGPLVIICLAYGGIWYGIRKRTHLHPRHSNEGSTRLTCTVLIVIGLFVLAWMPFFIVRFILDDCQKYCIPWRLFFFTKVLHFSNSGINPVIYGLRIPEYRKFITQVLHLKRLNFLVNYYALFETTNELRRQCSMKLGDGANGASTSRPNSRLIKTSVV